MFLAQSKNFIFFWADIPFLYKKRYKGKNYFLKNLFCKKSYFFQKNDLFPSKRGIKKGRKKGRKCISDLSIKRLTPPILSLFSKPEPYFFLLIFSSFFDSKKPFFTKSFLLKKISKMRRTELSRCSIALRAKNVS